MPVKVVLYSLIAMFGFAAVAEAEVTPLCQKRIDFAEEKVKGAVDRWNVGEGGADDIAVAKLASLVVQLECEAISQDQYCEGATPETDLLLTAAQEKLDRGRMTTIEFQELELEVAAWLENCN